MLEDTYKSDVFPFLIKLIMGIRGYLTVIAFTLTVVEYPDGKTGFMKAYVTLGCVLALPAAPAPPPRI